ncbi:MAG: hypothetical protein K6F91_11185 [Ruminococcus sp.]|nr:hypothetical protein [Ruminococcus sp.]
MKTRRITTTLAALALCLSAAAMPTTSCIRTSCKGDQSCVTACANKKCSSKKSTCTKGKCSESTDGLKALTEILKRLGCKTCK